MSTPPSTPTFHIPDSFLTPVSGYSEFSSPSSGYFSSPFSENSLGSSFSSGSTLSTCSQEEYDNINAKLFAKFLPNELQDSSSLFKHFQKFGKIVMLSLNTKRHVALIEYAHKKMAVKAKKEGKLFIDKDGKQHQLQIFWGKRIVKPVAVTTDLISVEQFFHDNCRNNKVNAYSSPPGFEQSIQ